MWLGASAVQREEPSVVLLPLLLQATARTEDPGARRLLPSTSLPPEQAGHPEHPRHPRLLLTQKGLPKGGTSCAAGEAASVSAQQASMAVPSTRYVATAVAREAVRKGEREQQTGLAGIRGVGGGGHVDLHAAGAA